MYNQGLCKGASHLSPELGKGGGLGGFGGSHGFQGEPREDKSPLTEYKGGTVEN